MGWPKPSHGSLKRTVVLESEPDDKLNHASALLFSGLAEVRIGLSELSRRRILLELQRQIGVVGERPHRVVQEVVALNAELQIFRFRHSEILEQSEVRVKVRGSVCYRQQRRAVLADGSWSSKAIPVYELMRAQIGGGVASYDGIELHSVRSQDGLVAYRNTIRVLRADRVRNDPTVQLHVVVRAGVVAAAIGDVGATLDLGDARDLPAAGNAREETMGMQRVADVDRISNVEQVPAIGGLHTIVALQVKGIDTGGPIGLAISIRAEDAHSLLKGVVCLNGVAAQVPAPSNLHRLVVRVKVIGRLVQVTVTLTGAWVIQWPVELGISLGGIGCAQHRADGHEVEIASESTAAWQVSASVAYISHLEETLPGGLLCDGNAPAVGVRLLVIPSIDRRWSRWRSSNVHAREIGSKQRPGSGATRAGNPSGWAYAGACDSCGSIQTVGKLPGMIVEASPTTPDHGLAGSEYIIGGTEPRLIEQFSGGEASQRNGGVFRVPQESAENRRIRAVGMILVFVEDGVTEILAVDPRCEVRESYSKVNGQLPRGFP